MNRYIFLGLVFIAATLANEPDWDKVESEAVGLLQEYLRIDTGNPPGDVRPVVTWMEAIFRKEGIPYEVISSPDPSRQHLLAEIPGKDPSLKTLLLMNHMDVVPADPVQWSVPPFSGVVNQGYIYGRGAIDMKGMGIMELMAVVLLKRQGWQPVRTVKFLAVPDEEVFGEYGARWIVENYWERLNPEWVWDEGGVGTLNSFPNTKAFLIAVSQKSVLWVDLVVEGRSGHGSRPFKDHPNEVLVKALNRIIQWETPLQVNPGCGRII